MSSKWICDVVNCLSVTHRHSILSFSPLHPPMCFLQNSPKTFHFFSFLHYNFFAQYFSHISPSKTLYFLLFSCFVFLFYFSLPSTEDNQTSLCFEDILTLFFIFFVLLVQNSLFLLHISLFSPSSSCHEAFFLFFQRRRENLSRNIFLYSSKTLSTNKQNNLHLQFFFFFFFTANVFFIILAREMFLYLNS